jgi:5-methylthioadenosine/S-adenosylhomocysteine deaminase
VRLDRPNAVPLYDVYSQMVYALKGSDVRDVMVNGRLVVSDAQALTVDSKQVIAKAEEFGRKVRDSLASGVQLPQKP